MSVRLLNRDSGYETPAETPRRHDEGTTGVRESTHVFSLKYYRTLTVVTPMPGRICTCTSFVKAAGDNMSSRTMEIIPRDGAYRR